MTILYITVYIGHTRIFRVDVGTWIVRVFGIVEIMIFSNPLCDSATPFCRCGVVSCGCPQYMLNPAAPAHTIERSNPFHAAEA